MMKQEIADSAREEPNYNGYKAEMALPVVGTGDSRRTWQRLADIQHWDSSETTNGCAFPTHDGRGNMKFRARHLGSSPLFSGWSKK